MYKISKISGKLTIKIHPKLSDLSSEIESRIGQIWDLENAKRDTKLFNGSMLSLLQFKENILEVQLTDYRRYLAQLRHPDLYEQLGIHALCVSGITEFESKFVFGRRASHLTQDPGKWELAPSGGIGLEALKHSEDLMIEEQTLLELEEELGIKREFVSTINPIFFIENEVDHSVEIGVDLKLSCSGKEFEDAQKHRSDEYSELIWVEKNEIAQFCAREKQNFVEISLEILRAKFLLP